MQISNNKTNTNFQGAFRIKPHNTKAKIEINALFTQGRQIFRNVLEKGDEIIVLRDQYDKRVGKYMKENNFKEVEYYPTINTKSGLDSEEPQNLIKLMKEKAAEVKTEFEDILTTIKGQKRATKPRDSKKIKKVAVMKEVEMIANALRLNIEKPVINLGKDFTHVRDNQKLRTIEVIRFGGTSYVHVKPDSLNEDSIKCIIDGKGNVVKRFNSPDEISSFMRTFRNLKKQNINVLV